MTVRSRYGVRIERNPPIRLRPFTSYFRGFERVGAVRELFGARTGRVLRELRVEFFSSRFGYMGTSDVDGHLLISTVHLAKSDFRTVYLDVVHELCHVRQFREGRPLFYPKLPYMEAPSEIEAYGVTVREGRRLGMTDRELWDYLTIEWVGRAEVARLARRLGVAVPASRRRSTSPVRRRRRPRR